ncbi:MAG: class I tRNA ligase family protein [Candidatus Beckwithbacteria bacterium]
MKKPFFSDEPAMPDFVALEKVQAVIWEKAGIIKKYLKKNSKAKQKFSFLDGPITANNPMGVHHARGRTYKDLWQRYFNMKGYRQRFQNGFDCQGLWVEVEVEKDLKFKTKKDIAQYGIEKFVNQCKARVEKYSKIQTEQSQRLGMWLDWDNSYFTMSDANNYAIWNFLKTCHQRGWIYKGKDVVPWCPRCETAISQHEILTEDYKEVVHDSIFFTLPLLERKAEALLVWTTTPWTLPANIAVAVDATYDYSLVQTKSQRRLWLLKALAKTVLGDDFDKILETKPGKDMIGWGYQAPFQHLPAVSQVKHQIIPTDPLIMPITIEEGTGLVHTSTSTGAEDYQLGKKLKLPVVPAINDQAEYLPGFGALTGQNAKKHPELIFDFLKSKPEFFYQIKPYKHRYPACWRCKTELVWKITDEWYISVDKPDPTDANKRTLRQQMIEVTKKVCWIPEFGLERELDWLKNMHDWLISKKNRYWGLALPIYECSKCHHFEVIGSKAELKQKAVSGWSEFDGHSPHKPWIDKVKINCSSCGQTVGRIEPVGNPWLDAGIVSFSTLPKDWFPADFITECYPGQFKNWFYSLLVMATVLVKTNPMKTVLGYESVVGEDNRPMHKSWGNAIEFNEGAQKIGVDIMRWLYAKVLPTTILPFGYTPANEVKRQVFLMLWNSYRFFISQANAHHWQPEPGLPLADSILDRWILSRLQNTLKTVTGSLDKFYSAPAIISLEDFINDFSTWYIRRSRNRVSQSSTFQTLYFCLTTLSQLMAPITPYLSDYLFTHLTKNSSVHLSSWPKLETKLINSDLEKDMAKARRLVEKIHAQRQELRLKVRQPLAKATIAGKSFGGKDLQQLILEETNLKSLVFDPKLKAGMVKLDSKLTPKLKAEGEARDLIRQIQQARKQIGTDLNEPINLELPSWPKEFAAEIKQKTLVKTLKFGDKLKVIRI